MGVDVTLNEIKAATKNHVTLLGNIPPRDVLAAGTADQVACATKELIESLSDTSKVLLSCGGGMPPGVSSENITAFMQTVKDHTR
jgi:uroporphyrinogen decarboxylase